MSPPTDTELQMTGDLIRIGCVLFAALFLAVAVLATCIGTSFTDMLVSILRAMTC
jgi:hypothetical protein